MRYTKTLNGREAKKALRRGIEQISVPVSATIGAGGMNGIYQEHGIPTVTNDGVSIARRIVPQDAFERIGADLIRDVCEKTNEEAGDGTTTSIVLASALIAEGDRSSISPARLKNNLQDDLRNIKRLIEEIALPVTEEDLYNIARVSVEDDSLARVVHEAFLAVGENGQVFADESMDKIIETDTTQGYFYNKGYANPYFVTDMAKKEVVLSNPAVLVTDQYYNLNGDLIYALNAVIEAGYKSVVIIADKVEGELLSSLIANKEKGILASVVIPKPDTPEELEDIASLVGGIAITGSKQIKKIELEHFGTVDKVVITVDKSTFISDNEPTEAHASYVETLKDDEDEKVRYAKLTSGISIIKVGARTDSERRYLKLKVDDAICAVNSAKEEGYVPGAGYALYQLSKFANTKVMKRAMKAPYLKILQNAGYKADGSMINVKNGSTLNPENSYIIDPAKVTRVALENAVSVATTYLSISSVTAFFEEKSEK